MYQGHGEKHGFVNVGRELIQLGATCSPHPKATGEELTINAIFRVGVAWTTPKVNMELGENEKYEDKHLSLRR